MICNAGGAVAIVDYITEARGNARLPGIITLGYISAFDESLAMSVIAQKGIAPLKDALIKEPDDLIKAAAGIFNIYYSYIFKYKLNNIKNINK